MQNLKNVLIANHDGNIVDLVEHSVSLHGYKVHKASNGKKALELIDKGNIGLIFLDLQISELNGLDILIKLKERKYEIPVVMQSVEKLERLKELVTDSGYKRVIGYVGENDTTFHDFLEPLLRK